MILMSNLTAKPAGRLAGYGLKIVGRVGVPTPTTET
jgi:hypothetical protein